jgi:hypothetical protein
MGGRSAPVTFEPEFFMSEESDFFDEATDLANWTETQGYGFLCLNNHEGRGYAVFSANAVTFAEAKRRAEEAGWRKEGDVWLCPDCAGGSETRRLK